MSDDLRERVARAIAESDGYDHPQDWQDKLSKCQREGYLANADDALAEMGGVRWHKVEQKLPPVGLTVLVASHDGFGWRVRSACLFIRHEGVLPMPKLVEHRPTDFWFDAPRGQNDMRLVRPGMMWADTPSPEAAIESRVRAIAEGKE